MKPKVHVIEGRESEETRLAENQSEFQTLPTLFFRDHEGFHALSAWEFEDEGELEEFLRTRTLYVSQLMPEGDAPRPILPSVYAPDIPERPAEPEGSTPEGDGSGLNFSPVIFEFRLVALDRQTGNPVCGVEGGARIYVDLTTLSAHFAPSGAPTNEPTEVIDRHLETFARVLANAYGGDVYCRLYGSAGGWKVTEGKLEDGAHLRRTIRAGNSALPPVDVAALDVGGVATVAEAIRMSKELRSRFKPPFRLLGFSQVETPDVVSALGEVITSKECQSVPEVVAHFRAALRPRGDYCLLIAADGTGEEVPGVFLFDLRLFEKARSN